MLHFMLLISMTVSYLPIFHLDNVIIVVQDIPHRCQDAI